MKIQVNYDELRTSANALRQKAGSYEETIQRISARVQELQSVWQGTDSQAFAAQMEAVRPQLMQMKEITDSYSRLLDQAADAYQNLQASRAACARML